jgi:ferric-dicitrate binding protein FerR (iron transport regulator)
VSIAQQTATPTRPNRARHPHPFEPVPVPRRGIALAKIGGLVALTAFGAALAAAVAGIGVIMMVTSLGR